MYIFFFRHQTNLKIELSTPKLKVTIKSIFEHGKLQIRPMQAKLNMVKYVK